MFSTPPSNLVRERCRWIACFVVFCTVWQLQAGVFEKPRLCSSKLRFPWSVLLTVVHTRSRRLKEVSYSGGRLKSRFRRARAYTRATPCLEYDVFGDDNRYFRHSRRRSALHTRVAAKSSSLFSLRVGRKSLFRIITVPVWRHFARIGGCSRKCTVRPWKYYGRTDFRRYSAKSNMIDVSHYTGAEMTRYTKTTFLVHDRPTLVVNDFNFEYVTHVWKQCQVCAR